MTEQTINAERVEQLIDVFGSFDENIKKIETEFGVKIVNRGTELKVQGEAEAADQGARALEGLLALAAKGEAIDEQKVRYLIELVKTGNEDKVGEIAKDVVCVTAKGRPVKAKTLGQQKYLKAIERTPSRSASGPRAPARRISPLRSRRGVPREDGQPHHPDAAGGRGGGAAGLSAGRPAEQGGPLSAPALRRAVRYARHGDLQQDLERGNIEVAPLAYMRGRTLDDSFIILDEAQNTTREQMKMFLTRLGFGSKIVITGDITQVDLPPEKTSGLREVLHVLNGIDDIAICRLTGSDVVRHALVQKIVAAYDKFEQNRLPAEPKKYFKRKQP